MSAAILRAVPKLKRTIAHRLYEFIKGNDRLSRVEGGHIFRLEELPFLGLRHKPWTTLRCLDGIKLRRIEDLPLQPRLVARRIQKCGRYQLKHQSWIGQRFREAFAIIYPVERLLGVKPVWV